MWDFAADVCGGYRGRFDEQMNWLQILGLILLLMPFIGLLTFEFIVDWKETLFAIGFTLAVLGTIFLGAFIFLLGGKL